MDLLNISYPARRMGPASLEIAAQALGCDVAAVGAVLAVEASGGGFDSQRRIKALFEPHKFYKHLGAGPKRDLAVAKKLAYAKWKPGNYPRTLVGVYAQIKAASEIDEEAALKATSFGLGQVLGEYHDECGFATARAFVDYLCQGEDEQLQAVVKLIKFWRLDDELARHDWAGFARGYNGPGYAANKYDTKLADAYASFGADHKTVAKATKFTVLAELGAKGPIVFEVQAQLNRVGFTVPVDGDYGPGTKRAVNLFQLEHGLVGDGRVGPKTWEALKAAPEIKVQEARAEATKQDLKDQGSTIVKNGDALTKLGGAGAGAVTVLKGLDVSGLLDKADKVGDQAQKAQEVAGQVQGFASGAQQAVGTVANLVDALAHNLWIVAVVVLVAVAFLGTQIVKARVNDHRTGKTV